MAIANRTLDQSEQKKNFSWSSVGVYGTGITSVVCVVPWPSSFIGAQVVANGLSGAPNYTLSLGRFIAGSGYTTWTLATGTSNVAAAFGTSGAGAGAGVSGMVTVLTGTSALSSGVTLANLQANDVIFVTSGVANTAAVVSIGVVLQPTQDIKSSFALGI